MKRLTLVVAVSLAIAASTFAGCDGGVRAVVPLRDDAGAGGEAASTEAGNTSVEPSAGASGSPDATEGGSSSTPEGGAPAGGASP